MDHAHGHSHDLNIKKIDRLSSTKVRMTVEFSEETVKNEEKATANRYMQMARIPGFRPGKAPLKMVRDKFKDDIRKDVVSHLLEAGLAEALEKSNLQPVNRPRIELAGDLAEGKPFEFHAEFEVQPEIPLTDYKGVKLKKSGAEASDEDVNKAVENLRDRLAVLEPSDKEKAEKGMYATIEIGYHLTATPDKKEEPKPFQIEIGAGELLPDLETAFTEMKVGEAREVKGKFPEEYNEKTLAGQEALFQCKLVELKQKALPEVNDAFAAQIKEGSTLLSLRQEIRENIAQSKKDEQSKAHRDSIVDHLITKNKFDVPSSLVEQQSIALLQWMEQDMKRRGYAPSQLKQDDLDAVKQRAEHMVRSSLLLKEIALKEKITLDERKLGERVSAIATQLNRSQSETEKYLSGKGMLDRLRDEVLTDQIFDFLLQNAQFE